MNGATCNDAVNSYKCACVAAYTGTHCETGKSYGQTYTGYHKTFSAFVDIA